MTVTADRRGIVPPHDLEAEEALLGAMLLSAAAAIDALALVRAEDFYAPKHQAVFAAVEALVNRGEPADPVTVAAELESTGQMELLRSPADLVSYQVNTPSTANAPHYAQIVADHALRRRLGAASASINAASYDLARPVDELVSDAEADLLAVADHRFAGSQVTGAELATRVAALTDELARHPGQMLGVPTGFADLDRLLRGLRRDHLVVVGGRPSMGKTALALQLAVNAAVQAEVPTAVFSLEMGLDELGQRATALLSGVSFESVEAGMLTDSERERWNRALGVVRQAPLMFDDVAPLTVGGLRSRVRRLVARHGVGLVVVDYLQLLAPGRSTGDRQVDVSTIVQGLKMVARELHVPIVVPAQLSRAVEIRQDKRPVLSDLRESGNIEAAADVALLLYRPDYYDAASDQRGTAEVIVAKNRNGRAGVTVRLAWRESVAGFGALASA